MNSLIGRLYGIFCFLPFSNWRQLHLAHHEWTGNVEKDPSMTLLVRFRAGNFHNSRWVRAAWRLWIPWLGLMQHVVFWRATVSQREFGFLAVLAAYFVLAAFAFGPAGLAFGLVLYLCGVEIVNFPHHLGFMQHEGGPRFAARDQHAFVRSCTYPRWIAHLILLNFNLHTEHHLFPTHPWYQLGVLHRELESAAGSRFNFSRASEWILHNRRRDIDEVFAESFVAPVTGNVRRAA